jgi:DNA-binding NarL/FixJ family response regulator
VGGRRLRRGSTVGWTHALLSTARLATLFNLPLAIAAGWLLWRSLELIAAVQDQHLGASDAIRPSKLTPHQLQEALRRLAKGETQSDIARTYNVHPTSIGRLQASTPPFRREEGPAAAAQV